MLSAYLLTLVESEAAGRTYTAYGGIYIVASLGWLWLSEGHRPNRWDLGGAAICVVGAVRATRLRVINGRLPLRGNHDFSASLDPARKVDVAVLLQHLGERFAHVDAPEAPVLGAVRLLEPHPTIEREVLAHGRVGVES